MAKHFSWCLRRMVVLTNRLNVYPPQSISVRKFTGIYIQPKFPQIKEIDVDYEEPKSFMEFKNDFRYGRKHAMHALVKILSIDPANAKKAIDRYPVFQTLPKNVIHKNFHALREAGVYKSVIKDNKYLLAETEEDLKKKLQLIQKFDIDINDAVHLFPIEINILRGFVDKSKMDATYLPNGNRIRYLAEKFNVSASVICHLLTFNLFMLRMPAPKLLSVTEYILGIGMSGEHIMQDLHIYRYRIGLIQEKLELAKKLNIEPLKPWIIRCSKKVWEKNAERVEQVRKTVYPHKTIHEYIAEILECDEASINFLFNKDRFLKVMNIEKISTLTRLLRDEGYNIEDIQRSPRTLHRSHRTLLEYFKLRREYGVPKLPLCTYLLARKKFIDILVKKRSRMESITQTM